MSRSTLNRMDLLTTIYRHHDMNLHGTILFRKAYRAVIEKQGYYLLVQSQKFGEYKFPGGGKEHQETRFDCLSREVREETGYQIKTKIKPLGKTMEYARDFLGEYDIFAQESKYYLCDCYEEVHETKLDDYEMDYGYRACWVRLEDAIQQNESIPTNDRIPWKERDTFVLKYLLEKG